ncbi:MAG: hypothetical protein H6581_21340 [Bacteroidia bacterium]|nr:hypothetical protein [Bacteroidia bacterium]
MQERTFRQACTLRLKEIAAFLHREFGNELAGEPFSSGAFTHVGIPGKGFEQDLVLPFRYLESNELEDYFERTGQALEAHFSEHYYCRQRVSHTVDFMEGGKQIRFEVVPAMATRPGSFKPFQDVWLWNSTTRIAAQTNLNRQSEGFSQMDERQKQIIRLLIGWKSHKHVRVPTYLLGLIVQSAFPDQEGLLREQLFDRLLGVLEYIQHDFPRRSFRDWANTSNDLKTSISVEEQQQFLREVSDLYQRLCTDDLWVIDYFRRWE